MVPMNDVRLRPDFLKVATDGEAVLVVVDPETTYQVTIIMKPEAAIKAGEYLIACGRGLLEGKPTQKGLIVTRERPLRLDS